MDKGMQTDMILIDFQKAFGTLDHNIFLEKMTCLGFKTPVIKWFELYLANRKLIISMDVEPGIWAVVSLRGLFGTTPVFNTY